MYNGLLKLTIPRMVTPVAFADDVALVIVGKHLEDIKNLFNVTFSKYAGWMNESGLKMTKHKTEVTLITGRKTRETIALQVGKHEIESKPSIRYLGVMIDARLNFKDQASMPAVKQQQSEERSPASCQMSVGPNQEDEPS